MTAPQTDLKSWIVDIENCISVSLFESGPRCPKQEAFLRNYVQNKSGHRWVEEKKNYTNKKHLGQDDRIHLQSSGTSQI